MAWRGHLCRAARALAASPSRGSVNQIRRVGVPLSQQIAGFVSATKYNPGSDLRRSYSTDVGKYPAITDPDVKAAFKELMASGWDEISKDTIDSAKKALSKGTGDKTGQDALRNVFRAAEASVEFTAVLVNIRMALEERTGLTGEDVTELPASLVDAVSVAYKRYMTYIRSFASDEAYLRKKVESELGTRLIHLKQRVSGLGSEWGEINVIGTSGLSGSYVEQRA